MLLIACLAGVFVACDTKTDEENNGADTGVEVDAIIKNILYQLNADGTGAIVTGIGSGFQGERIVIPDTTEINKKEYPVTEIGAKALQNFDTVKSVKLPASLKKIGESAFFDCDILESIAIPE